MLTSHDAMGGLQGLLSAFHFLRVRMQPGRLQDEVPLSRRDLQRIWHLPRLLLFCLVAK